MVWAFCSEGTVVVIEYANECIGTKGFDVYIIGLIVFQAICDAVGIRCYGIVDDIVRILFLLAGSEGFVADSHTILICISVPMEGNISTDDGVYLYTVWHWAWWDSFYGDIIDIEIV